MPTHHVRLPASPVLRRGPVDVGHVHWCSRLCVHITSEERQIVEQVAQGKTNQQIALRLDCAEQRIKNTLSKIMCKLGVQSRTELALLAVHSGLIKA
jgi:DNA-binding NarL/FixJ family response regulator